MGRRYKGTAEKKEDLKTKQRTVMYDAVKEFNKMIPTLNGFVRALTGNKKARVRAGAVTETDGETIFIRPPLALAVKVSHERELCNIRNSDKRLMCPACALDEDVWRKLHHEMAHIVGKSMAAPTARGLHPVHLLIDEYHPPAVCKHGIGLIGQTWDSKNYLEATGRVSMYLHYILQSIEDSRIDANMLNIKPGLRTQFYAATREIFTYGVEGDNPNEPPFMWREAPLQAQVTIGLNLIGSGYYIEEGWFRPEAQAVLADPTLVSIVEGARNMRTVEDSVGCAVQALRRLVEMGLFEIEKCKPASKEEQPPPSLDKPGDEGEKSDETDEPEPTDSDGDGDQAGDDDPSGEKPDDNSTDDSSDDAESSDGGDGSGDDASDPTGDGSAGDSASDGAFGDDFENDDRSSGSDKEGGDSADQSDGSQVPGEHGSSDGSAGQPEADGSDDEDSADEESPVSDGEVQADSTDSHQSEVETSGDEGEEGSASDREPAASSDDSSSDGNLDAEDSDGEGDGQPTAQGEGDIGSGPGGSSDSDEQSVDAGIEGPAHEASEEPEASEDPEALGSHGLTGDGSEQDDDFDQYLDDPEYGDDGDDIEDDSREPVGESVWDEENPHLQAIRSMTPEELGLPEDIGEVMERANPHEHVDDAAESDPEVEGQGLSEDEILAIVNQALTDMVGQASVFDRASQEVGGVTEYTFPEPLFRWERAYWNRPSAFMPSEQVMGPALLKARAVFADNARTKKQSDLKGGRVDTRKLGRRVAVQDDRLFYKKQHPGKRDYVVGITVDCSGSTSTGNRMERIKRAVFAKAEILGRLGIPFYITGHTGGRPDYWTHPDGYWGARSQDPHTFETLMILWVKKVDEPWDDKARERLANLAPLSNNFDGHTLEYHRKILETRRETDKILIYYTDGAMPAANYDEELEILKLEIDICKRKSIKLLAVGINTDSPSEYGFDTVQVDSDQDIMKVVAQLERVITVGR